VIDKGPVAAGPFVVCGLSSCPQAARVHRNRRGPPLGRGRGAPSGKLLVHALLPEASKQKVLLNCDTQFSGDGALRGRSELHQGIPLLRWNAGTDDRVILWIGVIHALRRTS
jgi:hypothetical protein